MTRDQQRLAVDSIIENYRTLGVPTDKLPYTPEFNGLLGRVSEQTHLNISDHEFWMLLTRVRKRGLLPRLR